MRRRNISEFKDKNGKSWPRIETEASTLSDAFREAAHGFMELVLPGHEKIGESESVAIYCESSDLEFLLADWINTLIYEMNARDLVFSRFEIHVEGIHVKGKAFGERWSKVGNKKTIELQGAAFDALSVEETDGNWKTSLVLNDRVRHPLSLRGIIGVLVAVMLIATSSCTTAREKAEQKAVGRTHITNYSRAKLLESFDLLTLLRVAGDGTNLCAFKGEEMAAIPQSVKARIDSWARGLPLDEDLPSPKELAECSATCRCGSWVYWLDQKGAYPSELNSGYQAAATFASHMKNSQALTCAKKVVAVCKSETLTYHRNESQ